MKRIKPHNLSQSCKLSKLANSTKSHGRIGSNVMYFKDLVDENLQYTDAAHAQTAHFKMRNQQILFVM